MYTAIKYNVEIKYKHRGNECKLDAKLLKMLM